MMTVQSEGLSREDRFLRTSHRLLLACATAFGLWQLTDMANEALTGPAHASFRVLSLALCVAWSALLLAIVQRQRTARKDPALHAALQDERANDVRLRAYRTAFWVTISFAALLGIPGALHLLAALTATKLVVVVGVTAFIVANVILDGE